MTGNDTRLSSQMGIAADSGRTAVTYLFAAFGMGPGDTIAHGGIGDPMPVFPYTGFNMTYTSTGQENPIDILAVKAGDVYDPLSRTFKSQIVKNPRTVVWTQNWRKLNIANSPTTCSDDGLSWPHRTLGYMMLKDDLFGIDVTGNGDGAGGSKVVGPGETRSLKGLGVNGVGDTLKAHDLDSVCLDCHNPTIWNATSSQNHTDTVAPGTTDPNWTDTHGGDNYNDETLLRGLP